MKFVVFNNNKITYSLSSLLNIAFCEIFNILKKVRFRLNIVVIKYRFRLNMIKYFNWIDKYKTGLKHDHNFQFN